MCYTITLFCFFCNKHIFTRILLNSDSNALWKLSILRRISIGSKYLPLFCTWRHVWIYNLALRTIRSAPLMENSRLFSGQLANSSGVSVPAPNLKYPSEFFIGCIQAYLKFEPNCYETKWRAGCCSDVSKYLVIAKWPVRVLQGHYVECV